MNSNLQEQEAAENEIHIDVHLIPPHIRSSLAAATLEFVRRNKDAIDRKRAELNL